MADILSHEPSDDETNKAKDLVRNMHLASVKFELNNDGERVARMDMMRDIRKYKELLYDKPHNDYLIILKTELFNVLSEKINNISWDDIARRRQRTREGEEGVITDDDDNSQLYLRNVETCLQLFHSMIRMSEGMDRLEHLSEFNDLQTTYRTLVELVQDLRHKMYNTVGGQMGGTPNEDEYLNEIRTEALRSKILVIDQIIPFSMGDENITIPQDTGIVISEHVREALLKEESSVQEQIEESIIPPFNVGSLRIYPSSTTYLRDTVRRDNGLLYIITLIDELQNSLNRQSELITIILGSQVSNADTVRNIINHLRHVQDIYYDIFTAISSTSLRYNNELVPMLSDIRIRIREETSEDMIERGRTLSSITHFYAGMPSILSTNSGGGYYYKTIQTILLEIYNEMIGEDGMWNILDSHTSLLLPIRLSEIERDEHMTDYVDTTGTSGASGASGDEEQRGGRAVPRERVRSPTPDTSGNEDLPLSPLFFPLLNESDIIAQDDDDAFTMELPNDSVDFSSDEDDGFGPIHPIIDDTLVFEGQGNDDLTNHPPLLHETSIINPDNTLSLSDTTLEPLNFAGESLITPNTTGQQRVRGYKADGGAAPREILPGSIRDAVHHFLIAPPILEENSENMREDYITATNIYYDFSLGLVSNMDEDNDEQLNELMDVYIELWLVLTTELAEFDETRYTLADLYESRIRGQKSKIVNLTNVIVDKLNSIGVSRIRYQDPDGITRINVVQFGGVAPPPPTQANILIPPDDISQDLQIITDYYAIQQEGGEEESVAINAFIRVLNAILQHGPGEIRDSMLIRVNREVFKVSDEISPHHFRDHTPVRKGELINTMHEFKTAWTSTESPNDRIFTRAFQESYDEQLQELL